jgi:hypothetical protein
MLPILEAATRERNSRFSVLVFNKASQDETANNITKSLRDAGFQSVATPTDLTESKKQLKPNQAWVIYTNRGQPIVPFVEQILSQSTHEIQFIREKNPSSLRRGDVQILLF